MLGNVVGPNAITVKTNERPRDSGGPKLWRSTCGRFMMSGKGEGCGKGYTPPHIDGTWEGANGFG